MIDKIDWNLKFGFDNNEYVIALLNKVQQDKDTLPILDESKETFNDVKVNKDTGKYNKWVVGYYNCLCSFNGKGFAGGYGAICKKGKNRFIPCYNNLVKQSLQPNFQNITFQHSDYKNIDVWNSLIYLDPPYINTLNYNGKGFNHNELWEKCKEWSSKGNVILLSELVAPDCFQEIYSRDYTYSLGTSNGAGKKVKEKLFIYVGDNNEK